MPLPLTGTVSVTNGEDGFTWAGAPLTTLNCVPGASIVVNGLGYFVKELTDTTHGSFTRLYAEASHASHPAEIEQISPDQVATATLNKRAAEIFAELDVIEANGQGFLFRFNDSTNPDADPGPGHISINHASIASSTGGNIDNLDGNGASIAVELDSWDDSTSLIKGKLYLRSLSDRSTLHSMKVTGAVVDGGGFRKLTWTYNGGNGSFAADEPLMGFFASNGDRGDGYVTSADVADPTGLAAYEAEDAGFLVFVTDLQTEFGAYSGRSGVVRLAAGPAWELAAIYTGTKGDKGDQGEKGWSPRLVIVSDGARRVWQLSGYVGGEGSAPTANVGDYLKGDGTFTAIIADAADVRGPGGTGTVGEIVAGDGIAVDNTDPTAPVVSATQQPIFGFLYGLSTKNNATDATNDIDIAAGSAIDSTNTEMMTLASVLTKRLDASWFAVTDQGGRMSAAAIADGTYHVFLIKNPTTGDVDAGFDVSPDAPTLPSGFTLFRRIASILRASGVIKPYLQDGDDFTWLTTPLDANANNFGTLAATRTLTLPTGVQFVAHVLAGGTNGTNASWYGLLSSLDAPDNTVSINRFNFLSVLATASGNNLPMNNVRVRTSTAAQVRVRFSASGAGDYFLLSTQGWTDARGR